MCACDDPPDLARRQVAHQLVVAVHVDRTHCNPTRSRQARSNTHLEALYHGALGGCWRCTPSSDQGRSQRRATTIIGRQAVNLDTAEGVGHLHSAS